MARLLVAIVLALACASPAWAEVPLETQSSAQLERTKLREEVMKLRSDSSTFARVAPGITVLVAVLGILATLYKQVADSSRQKTLDRAERESARTQRFDEQFARMVENLGSESNATRAAAAAELPLFLREQYAEFHEQVFTVLLTMLRFPREDVGDRLLARAFARVAPAQVATLRAADGDVRLDLSHCALAQVDLSGLDLSNADIAFADLHGANLRGCDMRRVRGFEVILDGARLGGAQLDEARLAEASLDRANLNDARLVSAKLQDAVATGASFRRAKLQEAHFERSVLRGAKFEGADLNNAYFAGAQLDDAARQSIALGALNWRKAHFDPETAADLELRSAAAAKKNGRPDPLADAGTP